MITAARYELRMMLRKRSLWVSLGVIVVLLAAVGSQQVREVIRQDDPKGAMLSGALLVNIFLPVAYGCLLADRLVRDHRLGVAAILDATPASPVARLTGKYLGVCAAVTAPVALAYFGFAVAYAIASGRFAALGWALAAFALVLLPAVLFVGAFALAVPLVVPAPLFRVLFVGYWFWGNSITPDTMPTLAHSIVTPIGSYPMQELLGFRIRGGETIAGPVPGAALNFLRPEATPVTAWLSIGVLLVLAALALAAASVRPRR
ncbi:hypothetical protein [Actinoplanes sp. NPDC089786]|uniref:hypothetical protein n=1 Tax=Actinoplanes sp. NPDC089786 TaxID=3155185 RepID=UPI00342ACC7E